MVLRYRCLFADFRCMLFVFIMYAKGALTLDGELNVAVHRGIEKLSTAESIPKQNTVN